MSIDHLNERVLFARREVSRGDVYSFRTVVLDEKKFCLNGPGGPTIRPIQTNPANKKPESGLLLA